MGFGNRQSIVGGTLLAILCGVAAVAIFAERQSLDGPEPTPPRGAIGEPEPSYVGGIDNSGGGERRHVEIIDNSVHVELDDESASAQLHHTMEAGLHGNPESAYGIFFDEWVAGDFVGIYPTESAFAEFFEVELTDACLDRWAVWCELYMFDRAVIEYPEWTAREQEFHSLQLSLEARLGDSLRLLEAIIPARDWPAFLDAVGQASVDVLSLSYEERVGGFRKEIPDSVVHLLRQVSSCQRALERECGWTDPKER